MPLTPPHTSAIPRITQFSFIDLLRKLIGEVGPGGVESISMSCLAVY